MYLACTTDQSASSFSLRCFDNASDAALGLLNGTYLQMSWISLIKEVDSSVLCAFASHHFEAISSLFSLMASEVYAKFVVGVKGSMMFKSSVSP